MRTRKQRFISALLAVAMMFVMLPVSAITAFAEDDIELVPWSNSFMGSNGLPDTTKLENAGILPDSSGTYTGKGWSYEPNSNVPTQSTLSFTAIDSGGPSAPANLIDLTGLVFNCRVEFVNRTLVGGTFSSDSSVSLKKCIVNDGDFYCMPQLIYDGNIFNGGVYHNTNGSINDGNCEFTVTGGYFEKFLTLRIRVIVEGGTFARVYGGDYGSSCMSYVYGGVFGVEPKTTSDYTVNANSYLLTAQDCTINKVLSNSAYILTSTDSSHPTTNEVEVSKTSGKYTWMVQLEGEDSPTSLADWGATSIMGQGTSIISFIAPDATANSKNATLIAIPVTTKTIKIPAGVTAKVSTGDDPYYDPATIQEDESGQKYIEVKPGYSVKLRVTNPKAYENYLWYVDGNKTPDGTGTDYTFAVSSDVTITYAVDSEFIKKTTYIPDSVTVALAEAEENEPFTENNITVNTDDPNNCYIVAPVTAKLVLTVSAPQKNYRYTWKNSADADETAKTGTSFEFTVSKNDGAKITLTATETTSASAVDVKAAYYVKHYQEQLDHTYKLIESDTELLYDEIGKEVTATAKNYDNYALNTEKSRIHGIVVKPTVDPDTQELDILTLELYYDLKSVPAGDVTAKAAVYRVEHYKEQANGSYEVVEDDTELLIGKIDETVEATAKKYAGYTLDAEKSVTSGTVFAPISNGEGQSPTILTLKLYYKMVKSPLTLDGANIISVKDANGNEFNLDDIKNADGSYNIPEGALVTIEPTNKAALADSGSVFDHWDITGGTLYQPTEHEDDTPQTVDTKKEQLTFVMPATTDKVTIKLMTRDATIDEGPDALGTAVIVGTVAVGGAILAWQGYQLGTELYLNSVLPEWAAIPDNRAELAALLWRDAGQPVPESQTLYNDIDANDADAQNAARWAVENELISLPDADAPDTFQPNSHVSRIAVIKAWKKAQSLKTSQPR